MEFNLILSRLQALRNALEAGSPRTLEKMANIFSIVAFSHPSFIHNVNTYTNYATDIMHSMFVEEKQKRFTYSSEQPLYREFSIECIEKFAKCRRYALSTVHLATLYLDIHMSRYTLSDNIEHVKLTSLIVCMLAAQSNETDDNIPSIKDFLHLGFVRLVPELGVDFQRRSDYKPSQIKMAYKQFARIVANLEFIILDSLEYSLTRSTVITFLDIFRKLCITEEDLNDLEEETEHREDSFEMLQTRADDYIKYNALIILHHPEFHQYLPSKNAAAVIAASRQLLGIKSFWSVELEFFTRASLEEIEPIITALFSYNHLVTKYMNKIHDFDYDDEDREDSGIQSDMALSSEDDDSQASKKFKEGD